MPQPGLADLIIGGLSIGMVLAMIVDLTFKMILDKCSSSQRPIAKKVVFLVYTAIAKIHKGKVVILIDTQNSTRLSVAHKIGKFLVSYAYYTHRMYPIILEEDGTVISLYYNGIQNWLPHDIEERTWMILQGARGFEE